jgi:hypothetical protein
MANRFEPLSRFIVLTLFAVFTALYSFFCISYEPQITDLTDLSELPSMVAFMSKYAPLSIRYPLAWFLSSYLLVELVISGGLKLYVGRAPATSAPAPVVSDEELLKSVLPENMGMFSGQLKQAMPYMKYLGYYTFAQGLFRRVYQGMALVLTVVVTVLALLLAVAGPDNLSGGLIK